MSDTKIDRTIAFLRMAAIELRRLAGDGSWEPKDAAALRHIAQQCDDEADELGDDPGNQ